jgi:hypothetical protein
VNVTSDRRMPKDEAAAQAGSAVDFTAYMHTALKFPGKYAAAENMSLRYPVIVGPSVNPTQLVHIIAMAIAVARARAFTTLWMTE